MVRDFAKRRILYTPQSKVYHFVQRATAQLKEGDQELYKKMFVRNDWKEISGHAKPSARDGELNRREAPPRGLRGMPVS